MGSRVRSYSKINLGLAVGPARADGFHGLATVYQTLALHDFVTVSARVAGQTKITLRANHPGVPCSARGDAERNTAWKMVAGALERTGVRAEVEIDIDKRLPVQGGMGAGSANAAAALIGLERELGVRLPEVERMALAAEVGSDVPLFLVGGTVLGTGRGEIVSELPDLGAMPVVVAVPGVGVSTKAAFAELDKRQGLGIREQGPGEGERGERGDALGEREANPGAKARSFGEPMRPEAEASGYPSEASGYPSDASGYPNEASGYLSDASGYLNEAALTFQQGGGSLEELSRVLAGVFRGPGEATGSSGVVRPGFPEQPNDLAEKSGPPSGLFDGVLNPLLALVRTGIENDFEEVVFSQHPSLRSTKRDLVGGSGDPVGSHAGGSASAAVYAALSGSGSALFGIYGSRAAAIEAQRRVQASGTRAILTETLTRQRYWDTMFAE